MKSALVVDNKVTNIVVTGPNEWAERLLEMGFVVVNLSEGEACQVGWSFNPSANPRFFDETPPPPPVNKDVIRYKKRAEIKDKLMIDMAVNNMARVKSGLWSVSDLVALTQDPQLKLVLDDVHTLSFELAIEKIKVLTNPILTQDIKDSWILKLKKYLF
jgi:hypothetical protein